LHALLNHPALQAGLIPFVVALASAELFQRLRLSGLAIIAGFAATVYFASDFAIEPLTGMHKIIWLGIAASALALPLTLLTWSHWRPILTALAAGSALWVLWDMLQQQALADALLWGAGCALYAGWLVFWFDGLRNKSVAAGNAGLALGLGTGMAAMLGASALLGQLSLALGAASAAYLLIQLITDSRLPCGRSFTLPLSLIAGSVASLAVLSSQQPWYTLPVLALIPLAAHIPIPEKWTVRLQSLALSLLTLACAAGAIYLAWQK
jgi:hypothetical protein